MNDAAGYVFDLTEQEIPPDRRQASLRGFAKSAGWVPSDEFDEYPGLPLRANGHLVVEHGLQNSAVISFLIGRDQFPFLTEYVRLQVLSLSYNNLVDWHLFPDRQGVTVVHNRATSRQVHRLDVADVRSPWEAAQFARLSRAEPRSRFKSLDEALVETVAFWRRALASHVPEGARHEALSELFNALILIRAIEDHRRWKGHSLGRLLMDIQASFRTGRATLVEVCSEALRQLDATSAPTVVGVNVGALEQFDGVDAATLQALFMDLYQNRFAPYQYDFRVISKHALSRIYEHYVSLLRDPKDPQLQIFGAVCDEIPARSLGSVYTPEYITRFFARYLHENVAPRQFQNLRPLDPACGSGLFLRSIVEMQCGAIGREDASGDGDDAFRRASGIDVDSNACRAARLSLALLHLVVTDSLPGELSIENAEALDYVERHKELHESVDAVLTNPPFVKWDHMSAEMRSRVGAFMGSMGKGKPDLFLAFLKAGMHLVKPGGHVLYVLPHSFLLASNARALRKKIAEEYWIRVAADLSEISVFEGVGSYVILLVLQKKPTVATPEPAAIVVKVKDYVGLALADALARREVSNEYYEVYETLQRTFSGEEWYLVSKEQASVSERLSVLPTLSAFVDIHQGYVSGDDDVFIRHRDEVPDGEKAIYAPLLRDREMERYRVPASTDWVALYPFVGGAALDEATLTQRFPETLKYLESHRATLSSRSAVRTHNVPWWRPTWPRNPEKLLGPKLVTPHLTMLPRFAADLDGRYVVSRAPFLRLKSDDGDVGLLLFVLGVLNSTVSYWQMTTQSHKYSGGYAMVEVSSLRHLRVPHPASIAPSQMKRLRDLVARLLKDPALFDADRELDGVVADMYGLSSEERTSLGVLPK